jgi:hypothetical protein
MDDRFAAGREFVRSQARVLEQRLFATVFEGAPAAGVLDALQAYRNADGGFGWGLEPDKRCPQSCPLDVEFALQVLDAAGSTAGTAGELLLQACGYLASVAGPQGAVALVGPATEGYPRAGHWGDWAYQPGLNPTAGLAGLLHKFGVAHPFVGRASEYCWAELEDGLPGDAHSMSEAMVFLENVPDRQRAAKLAAGIGARLPGLGMFRSDPDDPGYGLTPLHFAPAPSSPWRPLFSDQAVTATSTGWSGTSRPTVAGR